jgi:hypothetical protein
MPVPNSPFTSMVITFYTSGDDKDDNTRLEIFIYEPPDGTPAVAYYDDGQSDHIENPSTRSFTVPPVAGGFVFSGLATKILKINISPVGHDTWKFKFSASLYFADGTQAKVQSGDVALDQDANYFLYPLSAATIGVGTGG